MFIPYPEGDVNFDYSVNINDITILINYLLDSQGKTINVNKADLDKNGTLNIHDIVHFISLLI